MASQFYLATHGPDDPTKACIPFHLAVNGAAEAGIEAEINLAGDAVVLIQDRHIESVTPLGLPPLRELMSKIVAKGIPIYIAARGRPPLCGGDQRAGLLSQRAERATTS
jgi:predicted peroxiredoxin